MTDDRASSAPAAVPVTIEAMRRRHLRGVVAIEERTNHRPWSHRLFAGELRMPTSRIYLVAMSGHEVLGYCGLMLVGDEAHVTNVAVHPDHRRRGIARRLLVRMLREAIDREIDAVTLEVRASNTAAQELYRGFGFAPGGVRPNYYSDVGEDALIMWAHDIGGRAGLARLDAADAVAEEGAAS